jgi:peptide deformylase
VALDAEQLNAMGIRQRGDPILRQRAAPFDVPAEADEAGRLQARLDEHLRELKQRYPFSKGVGLAAPQIGEGRAMALVQPVGDRLLTLVNPEVVWWSQEQDERVEGCLSFFDVRCPVVRALAIRVRTTTLDGETRMVALDRAVARLALHEIDHLRGILCSDHLAPGRHEIPVAEYRQRDTNWRY